MVDLERPVSSLNSAALRLKRFMNGFRGKKMDSAATSRCVLLFRFVAQGIAPPPEKLNETNPSVFSRVRLTTVKAS